MPNKSVTAKKAMTNRTKSEFTFFIHCRIAAKTNFLLLFPARFAHARYSSRMIDRFLNWGDHGKPKSGKIKGRCQPPRVVPSVVSISFVDLCCLVRQTQFFPIWTLTTSSPSVTVFSRMKQTFRCTLSKILDLRYCTCIFNILLNPVWKYVGIDTILDLLRGGFHLFHLYVKI